MYINKSNNKGDVMRKRRRDDVYELVSKNIKNINERQAHILKMIQEKPSSIFECKNLINILGVSIKTVRSDLEGLVTLGFMTTVPLNKRLVGYIKSDSFESKLDKNRGKFL